MSKTRGFFFHELFNCNRQTIRGYKRKNKIKYNMHKSKLINQTVIDLVF